MWPFALKNFQVHSPTDIERPKLRASTPTVSCVRLHKHEQGWVYGSLSPNANYIPLYDFVCMLRGVPYHHTMAPPPFADGRYMRINLISSSGQTKRDGPPALGLGVRLTTPHHKK
jgi:hypothetical protein